MAQTEIWTERLLLRAAEERDLPAFKKFMWDEEAMKYWSTAAHTDIEQTKRFLDQMIKSPYNGVSDFVICLPDPENTGISSDGSDETATPIGKAGLWNGTEIGFIIAREFWGKGYAFEALDAIVKQFWATNDKVDARIKADVDPRNKRCLRLLKKLGFVEIGRAKDTYETHIGCPRSETTPSTLQAELLPRWKVLYDPDLLDHILSFLNPRTYHDVFIFRIDQPASQHLLWAALVCKQFFPSAMSVLWASMDSWELLLDLIPRPVLDKESSMYIQRDVLLDEHLQRLALYARYIRRLRIPEDFLPVSSYSLYVSIARHRPRLFPALQSLAVSFSDSEPETQNLLGVALFAPSPAMTSFEITNIDSTTDVPAATFLHNVYIESPKLKKLTLWGVCGPLLLRSVAKFSQLEHIELDLQRAKLSSDFLKNLSELERLTHLSLLVDHHQGPLTANSTFARLSATTLTFPLLEFLVLAGSPPIVSECMQLMHAPVLEMLIMIFRADFQNVTEKCFERVAQMAPSLRRFRSVTHRATGRVPICALSSLRSCSRLEEVEIAMRNLTVDVLRTISVNSLGMFSPWKGLRTLDLTGTWVSPIEGQLWISSLHLFPPVCPNLIRLSLSVLLPTYTDKSNIEAMNAQIQKRLRPCHLLESLCVSKFHNCPDNPDVHKAFSVQDAIVISRYIDHIFPHLKSIVFLPSQAEPDWSLGVAQLVEELQAVRKSERDHGCACHKP
ncbi:hypothetical protein CVT26_003050 [Gymnopilus dilepis]|uniref:N-acetyltransferase domain-containing protein n=1 Tax=Gymnopilus dilepis TaxID=231916 RepID=A0A409Y4U3_9AGAR|nr:hypothetical protein CVT26_003050 [Gymnopilus dilepis]